MTSKTKYGQSNRWQAFLDYGDPLDQPFRIESGYARVRLAESQAPILLAAGDYWGIESLNGKRSKVCVETKAAKIEMVILDAGELSTSWSNALGRSLDCMSSHESPPSIARFLLHFTTASQPELHHLTHQDLSLFLKTDRENISKHMARFRKRKLIDYGRFWIMVIDREALQDVAYP